MNDPIVPEAGVVINKAEVRRLLHDYHASLRLWLFTAAGDGRTASGQWIGGMIQATTELAEKFGVPIEVIEGIPAKEEK